MALTGITNRDTENMWKTVESAVMEEVTVLTHHQKDLRERPRAKINRYTMVTFSYIKSYRLFDC